MEMKNKYKYLAKNTLLFTISSFGSKILSFLLIPLYTNVLSTAEYGIADIISTTVSLLIYFFTLNIADGVLRFAIEEKQNPEGIFGYGLKILGIGSGILGIIIFFVQRLHLLNWEWQLYFFLFATYILQAYYSIAEKYLRAIDRVREVAISGLLTTVVTLSCNIVFLTVIKIGLYGYLLSTVFGLLISDVYISWKINKNKKFTFSRLCSQPIKKQMLMYSIPLIFNGIAWWMNSSLDRYFVTGMLGEVENGIYAVSYKIPTILTVVQTVFSQAWNLSAIKEYDSEDTDGFFTNTYKRYNAILVIAASGLILINIPLAKILFAKDFFQAWEYASVLVFSVVFSALAGFVGSIFSAVKNSRIFAVSTVIAAVVNGVLNFILIPTMGIMGAAVATIISFVCIWLIRLICARKYITLRIGLIKDVIAYLILICQIVAEHMEGHMYYVQIPVFVILVILYWKSLKGIIPKLLGMLKRRGNN